MGFLGSEPLGWVAARHVAVPTSYTHLPTHDLWGQEKRSHPPSTSRPNKEGLAVDRSISDSVTGFKALGETGCYLIILQKC